MKRCEDCGTQCPDDIGYCERCRPDLWQRLRAGLAAEALDLALRRPAPRKPLFPFPWMRS